MKIILDTDKKVLVTESNDSSESINLYSKKSFEILSNIWNKVGWNEKYAYTFTWMGRPIIQLPEDMVRMQEVIYKLQPDVIIETGVAHGGSLIYYASLCQLIGKGKVLGVDIEIRPHNRDAIEEHKLSSFITLIEGSSTNESILEEVKRYINENDKVLVILDSDHSKNHVLKELECYSPLVTVGSYIVATDGIMKDLFDVPRGKEEWKENNPISAVKEFLMNNPNFVFEQPNWNFNESELNENITHWPLSWLKRKKS